MLWTSRNASDGFGTDKKDPNKWQWRNWNSGKCDCSFKRKIRIWKTKNKYSAGSAPFSAGQSPKIHTFQEHREVFLQLGIMSFVDHML